MKQHVKFPEIEQFRNVIRNVTHQARFRGVDESGNSIYEDCELPSLWFSGTVKLHGTNAGVSYNNSDGMWFQSRENIITPEQDNAGFARFASERKEVLLAMLAEIADTYRIDTNELTITIFGEWCGGNIQKGVGICNLEKSFFIFGVKIAKPGDEDFKSYWVDFKDVRSPEDRIYNILDYPTYSILINFNNPQLVQNDLGDITEKVEAECPVAKAFGFEGVGEGVVWTAVYKGTTHRFKVKGEKHSSSKVKTLASVDVEKLNGIQEFVDSVVTKSRFKQAIEKTFGDNPIDIKQMGDLIRWVVNDVKKEESDTMESNGLTEKDVNAKISQKVRTMFLKKWNNPDSEDDE
jgi:hypothetical protein